MSELQSIFSEGKTLKVAGRDILIKPISVGDIPVVLDIVSKFFELMPQSKGKEINKGLITAAISKDFASVIKLIEVTTDLTSDEIKKLNIGAASLIVAEVIKDNADFFQNHVVPVLGEMTKTLVGTSKSKS